MFYSRDVFYYCMDSHLSVSERGMSTYVAGYWVFGGLTLQTFVIITGSFWKPRFMDVRNARLTGGAIGCPRVHLATCSAEIIRSGNLFLWSASGHHQVLVL